MKAIINGLRYDTEKATMVAQWDNGLSNSDFNNLSEELFITNKGAWFMHGTGGPNSRYAKSNGKEQWGSSQIVVLEEYQVLDWLEMHDYTDELENYFPGHIQDA